MVHPDTQCATVIPDWVAGVKSDRGVYVEPPLPKLPEAGGSYVERTFETTSRDGRRDI